MPIIVDAPSIIGRRQVVLMMDRVSESSPSGETALLLEGPASTRHSLWLEDEAQLEALSKEHPSLPIYGVWQTLLYNKAVDLSQDLHVFYTDESKNDGAWLFVINGVAVASGPVAAGTSLFSERYGFDLENAFDLSETDLSRLKLPEVMAEPLAVRRTEIKKAERRVWILTAAVAAGIAVVAVIGDITLDQLAKSRAKQAAQMKKQAESIMASVTEIKKNKSDVTPETLAHARVMLSRVEEISFLARNVTTTPIGPDDPSVTIEISDLLKGISFPVRIAAKRSGNIALVFSPSGGSDQALPAPDLAALN